MIALQHPPRRPTTPHRRHPHRLTDHRALPAPSATPAAPATQPAPTGRPCPISSPELRETVEALAPFFTRRPRPTARTYVAFTDGSCRVATGSCTGVGGWAVILVDPYGTKLEHHGRLAESTANRAEVCALLAAVLCVPDGACLSIQSDSRYVVDSVRRLNSPHSNEDLWLDLWELVVAKQVSIHATWIAGHNDHKYNTRADLLARARSRPAA